MLVAIWSQYRGRSERKMAAKSPGTAMFSTEMNIFVYITIMAYFSVCVIRSGIQSKVLLSIEVDKTVADIASKAILMTGINEDHVRCEQIFGSEISNTQGNILNATTPVSVLIEFKLMYLTLFVGETISDNVSTSIPAGSNVFEKMMSASKTPYDKLPDCYQEPPTGTMRGDYKLYNDILKFFKKEDIGFSERNVSSIGIKVLKAIHGTLWYITAQHSKLKDRGVKIPKMFESFHGYYDHKVSHKAQQQMQESKLNECIDSLSSILMLPWTMKFQTLYKAIDDLVLGLKKYVMFLKDVRERTQARNYSETPLRNPNFNFTLTVIEGVTHVKSQYSSLDSTLSTVGMYEPFELSEIMPGDRFERRKWLSDMQLTYPIAHYSYHQGNYLGNINFVWRLPSVTDRTDEKTVKTVSQIHDLLPKFNTRFMKREFFSRYGTSVRASKAVLRNLYRYLTDDCSAADRADQAVIDQRLATLLSLDDPDLLWDMRRMNGSPNTTKYDVFWSDMDKYFSERDMAVQERRHGEHLYLPYAISIEDLVTTIKNRVPSETLIPSNEWVRLQFYPTNPNTKTALHYTGRFNVKFALQTRQVRGKHEDSHFVASQLIYLKTFAVKYQNFVDFFWLDDKAIVPIGEAGSPVSTGVRPHNASLVPKEGPSLSALDHDYHVCGAIPSVAFRSDIPSDVSDSFFNGIAFVTVKDKVFSPSHAMRHGSETTNILKSHYSSDNVNSDNPVLITYTDGGPDHRTTFASVQLAAIAMFMWLDLDMFVTARTAPMGSWANLAERVNSVLNLALQNVSLEREKMSDDLELKMKRVLSLKTARETAARYPAFKQGLVNSVKPVIQLLEERFSHLKIKGELIYTNSAASNEDVDNFFSILKDVVDSDLNPSKLTKKDLDKSDRLSDFMQRHCRCRQYIFQIKKCPRDTADTCWYCTINPARLPEEVFDELCFVPDPVVSTHDKDKFVDFSDVYGNVTDDSARPSLSASIDSCKDKCNKKLLVANRVRDCILCVECSKPRCIYAEAKLTYREKEAITIVKELNSYTCGSPLFTSSNKFNKTVVVREGLRCSSLMETTYYASTTCTLTPVCFHCGLSKSQDFADDEVIQQLQAQYSIVRPICRMCKAAGKEAVVRGKRNVKKLRK